METHPAAGPLLCEPALRVPQFAICKTPQWLQGSGAVHPHVPSWAERLLIICDMDSTVQQSLQHVQVNLELVLSWF